MRILSETASVKLATPITVKFEQLRAGEGYDAKKESPNFSPVWQGGEWHLRDITNYMTTAAFLLMKHVADNREKWLTRFYGIGKEAVRPRKDGELFAFILPVEKKADSIIPEGYFRREKLLRILSKARIDINYQNKLHIEGKS